MVGLRRLNGIMFALLLTVAMIPPAGAATAADLNNRGIALAGEGKFAEAMEAYDQALALDPTLADAWFNKGLALAAQGDYVAAIEAFDKVIALNPADVEAWNGKGDALYDQGSYATALEAYDRALAFDTASAAAWNGKGNALYALRDYAAAIEAFDKAIAFDPTLALAWNNKGLALAGQGNYAAAIEAWDKTIALDPTMADPWYNKGVAFEKQGRFSEAIASYDEAIALDPTNSRAVERRMDALAALIASQNSTLSSPTTPSSSSTVSTALIPPDGIGSFLLPMVSFIVIIVILGLAVMRYRSPTESVIPVPPEASTQSGRPSPEKGDETVNEAKPIPQILGKGASAVDGRTPDTDDHDAFISYSSFDTPVADAVCAGLESRGIRCWIAPRDILCGMDYKVAIVDAIEACPIMILIYSSHANESEHVQREADLALQTKNVTIIPFRIEDVPLSKSMKYLISVPQWLDATKGPLEKHIEELGDNIRAITKKI